VIDQRSAFVTSRQASKAHLLQQGNQEVDGQHGVGDNLVLLHITVSDGTSQTKNLLQLELDGGSDLDDLSGKVVRVGDGGRELSSLGETGSEQTRDLLDQSLRSQESVVLLGELLDELLVLVEPVQGGIRLIARTNDRAVPIKRLTSSNPQRSCTRARSAWPGRRGQHRPRYRWTYEAWERGGA
jgi:hypothetical protein